MNTKIQQKSIAIISSLVAVCALVMGLFSPGLAYAASKADEGTPTPPLAGARLEFMCREERRLLDGQQDRLNLAGDVGTNAKTWIDEQKAKGKDVSSLESALATYTASLASAQAKHDAAQSTFDSHAGFDGNCKMTDRDQARTTLRSVSDSLREAHRLLADAGRLFHRTVQDWRRANRPARATATTTP